MTLKALLAGSALSFGIFAAAGAQAVTIYSNAAPTGEKATDAPAILDTFTAAGGRATASFIIDGYRSLDGDNAYEDDFTLKLNGAPIVVGTFNLGGGGFNVFHTAPQGTTGVNLSGGSIGEISFAGGQELLTVPVTLAAGMNALSFDYVSLSGPAHAGFQGLGDEGWGIQNVVVSSAIPEPAAWALMLVGFGGLGAMLRGARRRSLLRA